jgi:hypothetical protein
MLNKDFYYNSIIANRANSNLAWHAYDVPPNYLEVNNKGPNIYPKDCNDIRYTFNNHGFRSDEFDSYSDIPMLFTGCSYTEGVGLPVNKIWTTRLLDKLKVTTGKTIPHWNLALAGVGLDSIANGLYWHSVKFKKQLDYIVILFPPFSRREYCYNTKDIKTWFHPQSPGLSADSKIVDTLFADKEFINYQSIKNLALIDAVAKNLNAKVIYSMWKFPGAGAEYEYELGIIQENFSDFQYVKYPDSQYDIDLARDSMHSGPSMHEKISETFWDEYFSKL